MRRKQCVNVLLYDYLYLTSRHLRRSMVQTFILSAKTTQPSVLTYFEYEPTAFPGVYRSRDKWLKLIDLLILNELSNEPHNAFFKCFASRKQAREAAFATLERMAIWTWSEELWSTVNGLHTVLQRLEGGEMQDMTLPPEYLRKLGEGMRDQIIASLSPKQRLTGLSPQEILAQLSPEEILATIPPEKLLARLKPEQRLAGLDAEQRLAGLDPALIEAYLQKQKRQVAAQASRKAPRPRRQPKKTPPAA